MWKLKTFELSEQASENAQEVAANPDIKSSSEAVSDGTFGPTALDAKNLTRYQFWKDTGLAQNTAYRLYDDPTYIPGGTVMDKIPGFYGIQPGEYLEYLPDEDAQ